MSRSSQQTSHSNTESGTVGKMKRQYTIKCISSEQADLIKETLYPKGLYLYHQGNYVVALDNACGDAWTRAFKTITEARKWLISV